MCSFCRVLLARCHLLLDRTKLFCRLFCFFFVVVSRKRHSKNQIQMLMSTNEPQNKTQKQHIQKKKSKSKSEEMNFCRRHLKWSQVWPAQWFKWWNFICYRHWAMKLILQATTILQTKTRAMWSLINYSI